MSGFSFTPEQSAAINDRGGPLLVSAGAGSGKTRVLVERLLAQVCEGGANIDDFLVITYTKAAAAELRARILDALSQRLAAQPKDRHLRRQTSLVYRAQISTVHAFCSAIIRQNTHLLGIAPDFRSLDEGDSALLQARVLDDVLESFYDGIDSDPDFAALVNATSDGRDDRKLCRIVLDLYKALQSHAAPEDWLNRTLAAYQARPTDPGDTPWGAFLLRQARDRCAYLLSELERAISLLSRDEKLEAAYGDSFRTTHSGLTALHRALNQGFVPAGAVSVDFPRLKGLRDCADPASQAQAKAVRDLCKAQVTGILELVQEPQALLEELAAVSGPVSALFSLVRAFSQAYSKEKRRRGQLDFSDLEHLALRLLWDGDTPSALAQSLSARFREVCVDEYQDSSRVQEAIFQAVSQGGQKLFLVGDVKQSIYRFRLADPGLFLEKYRLWPLQSAAAMGAPRHIDLSRNFRSAPAILDAVNYVFSNIMSTESGELDYNEAQRLRPGRPRETESAPRVEFHLLDCQSPDESPDRPALEAGFIARRARELHNEGVPYGDMVILMRAPGGRMEAFAQAFAREGVPLELNGGSALWEQTELQVARALLNIIDNPRQDISLISVLRSPLYGFSPDDLARIRLADRQTDFYSALCASAQAGDAQADSFLCQLNTWRDAAADLPVDALLRKIYEETAMPAVFAAMPGGQQRQANLMAFLDYAHRFEAAGYKGLFGFLGHLNELIEQGMEPPGSAAPAEGGSAVRILSIHKSKGLEFPVVFLCDTAHRFNTDDLHRPVLIHPELGIGPKYADLDNGLEFDTLPRMAIREKLRSEQLAEEMRLLYVAMTRAEERLIITAAPQNAAKSLDRLCSGFTAPPAPLRVAMATSMADWLIPLAALRPEGEALRAMLPPLPIARDAGPAWRITCPLLCPDAEEAAPDSAAEAAAPGAEAAPLPDLSQRLGFVYPHQAALSLPSKITATSLKGRFSDFEAAADAPAPPRRQEFRRPSFLSERPLSPTERGTALHLAMQFLDFSACQSPEGLRQDLERLREARFISPAQYASIQPEKLEAFFVSPLGKRLLTAARVMREFKFSLLVDADSYFPEAAGEQLLLQGVVDCAFEEDGRLTIIDFKSDYVNQSTQAQRAAHYRVQLNTYAQALARITGLPVGHQYLFFFATGQAVSV